MSTSCAINCTSTADIGRRGAAVCGPRPDMGVAQLICRQHRQSMARDHQFLVGRNDGIGEHSARVRAALCRNLAWLGVKLDEQANAGHGPRISCPESAVSVWEIPTNEELMIAQHMLALAARRAPEKISERLVARA